MTPNFRALCATIVELWDADCDIDVEINELRELLATPPPEPPLDEQIAAAIQKGADQEFYATLEALTEYFGCGVELTSGDAREVLYELRRPHIVLDGWGNEKPYS